MNIQYLVLNRIIKFHLEIYHTGTLYILHLPRCENLDKLRSKFSHGKNSV